jgi:hypothetical protein
MRIDVDEELKKASYDMHSIAQDLLKAGFPQEHWELISRYIDAAIRRSQALAKGGRSLPKTPAA